MVASYEELRNISLTSSTSIPSFCSGSRIETMVRVSVCPSLTEGLSHSQMTLGQMLAVNHCKMLPLKPSHMAARPRTPAPTAPGRCRWTSSLSPTSKPLLRPRQRAETTADFLRELRLFAAKTHPPPETTDGPLNQSKLRTGRVARTDRL